MALLEVCLLDDSPINGYLGLVLKKPDAVVWLRTPNQRKVAQQIETSLASVMTPMYENREIVSYNIEEFIKICEGILRDYPEHDILLNITGGTRLQAILATDIFRKANKEIMYIDKLRSRIVDVKTGDYKSFNLMLTVNEFIALQGLKMDSGTRFDPEIGKRSSLSYFIGNNIDRIVPFIDRIREEWNAMGDKKHDIKWRTDDSFQKLTIEYEAKENKMKFRFGSGEGQKLIEITNSGPEYLFNGGWLRELVFLRVHRSQYDDVRLDVRINRNALPEGTKSESMIDIAMMKGCTLYIFQCFSFPITRDSFIELKAVQSTIQLLNAKGYIFVAHHPYHGFLERAKELGVEVISGRRISNFSI